MAQLYPEIEPYASEMLQVSSLHTIYLEQVGNPDGIPVVFLHGGPGGGIQDDYRRYFNPEKYRVVLFDQRGCGKSTPFAELKENTTWELVGDIEKIRQHLKIEKWSVFGGSWGSTLSLAYSMSFPERVSALFLRGLFLCRKKELHWFYQNGASALFPDAWKNYRDLIPPEERDNFMAAYYKRLTSENKEVRAQAAKAWSTWEGATSKLIPSQELVDSYGGDEFSLAFARIECHFFMNSIFMEPEKFFFENIEKIRHIPTIIVQGRYDVVCPPETAYEFNQAFPESKLIIVPNAGHSLSEKGITEALVEATDRFEPID